MMTKKETKRLSGTITVPGDKSISHRAVLLGSLSKGDTVIRGFLKSADCLSTISCFRQMGVDIEERNGDTVIVHGKGLHSLTPPKEALYCGNSGTTMRLLSGVLAGQNFSSVLTGDESICKRPMNRVIKPLTAMGGDIKSADEDGHAPLVINGKSLKGISYETPVASAQVKSAILLAGLFADGPTTVTEPALSRDHTERMLPAFGGSITRDGRSVTVTAPKELTGQDITVPGDISSAAYLIAAGCLVPDSEILIQNVGVNPTRAGILSVCRSMNADVTLCHEHTVSGEPAADILVRSSHLKAANIGGDLIPALIDELPVIALMACFAEGTTVISDAAELRVKESDRIAVMAENLTALGADVTEKEDGLIIRGKKPLHGAVIDSHKDHRIAMTFAVASLLTEDAVTVLGKECVDISYPAFYRDLSSLLA